MNYLLFIYLIKLIIHLYLLSKIVNFISKKASNYNFREYYYQYFHYVSEFYHEKDNLMEEYYLLDSQRNQMFNHLLIYLILSFENQENQLLELDCCWYYLCFYYQYSMKANQYTKCYLHLFDYDKYYSLDQHLRKQPHNQLKNYHEYSNLNIVLVLIYFQKQQ